MLSAFATSMVAGRGVLSGARPPLLLVGWETLRDTMELGGHALITFRLTLAVLWVAVPLWIATGGFRQGPGWLEPVCLAIGLCGLAAALPLVVTLAVVAANAAVWAVAIIAGFLLFLATLLRFVLAPFRR